MSMVVADLIARIEEEMHEEEAARPVMGPAVTDAFDGLAAAASSLSTIVTEEKRFERAMAGVGGAKDYEPRSWTGMTCPKCGGTDAGAPDYVIFGEAEDERPSGLACPDCGYEEDDYGNVLSPGKKEGA
jgi:hypothetical protein